MTDNVKTCSACGAKIGTVDLCSGRAFVPMKDGTEKKLIFHADPGGARCRACGVVTDAVHHANCPLERCPACHGPLQRCGCMVGSKPAPEEIKMPIKYSPETDELGVFGPMQDKILCYGLRALKAKLEEAVREVLCSHCWIAGCDRGKECSQCGGQAVDLAARIERVVKTVGDSAWRQGLNHGAYTDRSAMAEAIAAFQDKK